MNLRIHAAALLVIVSLVGGCGRGDEGGQVGLELGSGSWRFESVTEGADLDLVRGAQGGWHVWLSFRTRGFSSDRAMLHIETQVADESRPPQYTELEVTLERPDHQGQRYFIGWPEMLSDPGCWVDQLTRVQARMTDPNTAEYIETELYFETRGGDEPPPACE